MMHLPASVRVYLCASACDMRKSFDSLHALVTQSMELDAFAGRLFVFGNRRPDQDPVLGSRRIRGLGEAAGRRDLSMAFGDTGVIHGEKRRETTDSEWGAPFRHRSEPGKAAEEISERYRRSRINIAALAHSSYGEKEHFRR
jgi:IS66 Orf2 like protein